jgi:hypothetical protein
MTIVALSHVAPVAAAAVALTCDFGFHFSFGFGPEGGLGVGADHNVADDRIGLGLSAGFNSVALVSALAILKTLLSSLGKFDIVAVEI